MGFISISHINNLSPTPSGITIFTVSYRPASVPDLPGNYIVATTNLQVNPDGSVIGGAFIIENLTDNTSYVVMLKVNCSGFFVKQTVFVTPGGTTTTTTTTSTSSTTTTSTTAPITTTTTTTSTTSSTTTSTTTLAVVPQINWEYQELGTGSGSTGINYGPTGPENFQVFVTASNTGSFSIPFGNRVYIAVGTPSTPTPNFYYIRFRNETDGILLYDFSSTTPINYTSPVLQANKTYSILTVTNLYLGTTSTTSTTTTSTTANPNTTTTTSTSTTSTSTSTSTTTSTTSTSTSTSSTTTTTTTLPPTTTTTTTTSTSTTTTSTTSSTTTTTTTLPCPTIGGFETDGTGSTTSTTSTTSSSTTTSTSTVPVTTTTTTSSTTTTSTTAGDFNALVRFGTLGDGSIPTEAEILAGSFTIRDVSLPIDLNWGVESPVPTFYWLWIPNVHPNAAKTTWFEAADNQGTMNSGSDLFNFYTNITVSGQPGFVWITNYATQFPNNNYTFQ